MYLVYLILLPIHKICNTDPASSAVMFQLQCYLQFSDLKKVQTQRLITPFCNNFITLFLFHTSVFIPYIFIEQELFQQTIQDLQC